MSSKMAKFRETLSFAMIAITLLTTTVSCSPTQIETEAENDTETANAIASIGDDDAGVAPAAPVDSDIDSHCDCEDADALFDKVVRKLIDQELITGKKEFLKRFPIKKTCGSDGKFYISECEFQCARMKLPEKAELYRVSRGNCKRIGKGRVHKGKENTRNLPKPQSHQHQEKIARMQRPPNDPETLICICPRNFFPVCASNGMTYGNKCVFECAKKNLFPEMTIVDYGKCNDDDKTVIHNK